MEMTMETWNVDLVAGNETPGNISNRRGAFQGTAFPSSPIRIGVYPFYNRPEENESWIWLWITNIITKPSRVYG